MSATPIVIERTYDAPIEKVWKAITDINQMKKWYFPDIKGFKPEIGAEFTFTGQKDNVIYQHICKVLEVEAPKKLKHSWQYDNQPGNSFVTWELSSSGNKTTVKLTHEGLETFPATEAYARKNFEKGWTQIVGTMLREWLEKETVKQ
jgi:uncharacterized protein YndB with AHSA1/START domain